MSVKRQLDPVDFHVNVWPMERHRISELERKDRREALAEIFDALSVTILAQRLRVARAVVYEISRYNDEGKDFWRQNVADGRAWFRDVAKHAQALADLAAAYPRNFASLVMRVTENQHEEVENAIEVLSAWAERTRPLGTSRHSRRRVPDGMHVSLMMDRLEQTYREITGKNVRRVTKNGQPNYPFLRFMHGVWILAGIDRSDDAIDQQVRRWQTWKKTDRVGKYKPHPIDLKTGQPWRGRTK